MVFIPGLAFVKYEADSVSLGDLIFPFFFSPSIPVSKAIY